MADETGTGVFPNGPAQQMARDREAVIQKLLAGLLRGRSRALMNGTLGYGKPYVEHLQVVLGDPHRCVICGRSWETKTVSDLDDWFCSKHCPVCNGWEAVLSE